MLTEAKLFYGKKRLWLPFSVDIILISLAIFYCLYSRRIRFWCGEKINFNVLSVFLFFTKAKKVFIFFKKYIL